MWNWLVTVLVLVLVLLCYYQWKSEYWKRKNIHYEKPQIFVGNLGDVVLGKKSLSDTYTAIYNKHEDLKYCGIMNFGSPAILLRDPELIQNIISKEHDKYHTCCNEENNLAKDKRWKRTKAKISPQLTPLKVKSMFNLLEEIVNKLVKYINYHPEADQFGVDPKELTVKYASDIIGTCILGLESNNNDQLGLEIFDYNSFCIILNVISLLFPGLYKIKPPKTLSERLTANFKERIISAIKSREENNIKKHDFLGAIVELKILAKNFDFSVEDLAFKTLGFFLEGFETSVITLQHVLYELALNKNIQEKLLGQFEVMLLRNATLTYESLKEVRYLDMVIYETLRKHPPAPFLAKECDDLILPPSKPGSIELEVPKGTKILIPIISLHNDPFYFEEPDKFIPERFNEDLNYLRCKKAFVGFGDGPRFCLGHRFALTQLKIAVYALVTNFELELGEPIHKTALLEPIRFVYEIKSNSRLKFINRTKNKNYGN
nr:cytochrome P450 6j1-like [Onthophagus taurus]